MTCLTCKNWHPRKAPEMAKLGFAPCELGNPAEFKSMHFVCGKRVQAPDQIVSKRMAWEAQMCASREPSR